uniref:RAB17, member RAS oncogene family n=1 Tax=Gopherus agassizii TaxID=38772 RepID=A0A452IAT1_9SAUR
AAQAVGAGRPSTEQAYISKVVLLGRTAMGKSSTAFRYVKNDIRESMTTVGCSFFTQLGTAGQEMYHSVCHLYYRGANAAFLVYDIARKATFVRAKLWLRELEKEFLPDELVIVLVSNKADLAAQREVTFEVKSASPSRSSLPSPPSSLPLLSRPAEREAQPGSQEMPGVRLSPRSHWPSRGRLRCCCGGWVR